VLVFLAVERTFREYIAIFLTGDLKKVTAHYNEPLMLVATSRAVNRAEAEVIMGKIRDDLQARGIAEFVFDRLEVKMVGENVALVSFIIKQQTKDGVVVNVSAGTYSLRRADSGWKIAVISTYPPADFVKLD
jgi:ketosteroid isomerase-like protein